MSIIPRKCNGCRQYKHDCDTPVYVNNWLCDDCAVAFRITGTNKRLKNIAEANSKKWGDGKCPHQNYTNVPYTDPTTGRKGQKCICNKCGEEIYNVLT